MIQFFFDWSGITCGVVFHHKYFEVCLSPFLLVIEYYRMN